MIAGWSSPVARRAHNPKAAGSNPAPATKTHTGLGVSSNPFLFESFEKPPFLSSASYLVFEIS